MPPERCGESRAATHLRKFFGQIAVGKKRDVQEFYGQPGLLVEACLLGNEMAEQLVGVERLEPELQLDRRGSRAQPRKYLGRQQRSDRVRIVRHDR